MALRSSGAAAGRDSGCADGAGAVSASVPISCALCVGVRLLRGGRPVCQGVLPPARACRRPATCRTGITWAAHVSQLVVAGGGADSLRARM